MISPDLPITKSEEDVLNRSNFAKNLAQAVIQCTFPTSFSIGLYGKWGSGKTSLLNMVIEEIENIEESTIILRFNPWLCSDPKQLVLQFFKQMSAVIKLKKPAEEKVWELIDQYGDMFEAAGIIPIAGEMIQQAGKAITKKANEQVKERKDNLQKSKDQIIDRIIKEKIKIVITIDDIDRLSEEEIIAVFQLIKALADFPNTIYILAFDYKTVVQALGKVQNGDGREYLEKIIQVPFEIPAPDMDSIYDTLFSKINSIIGDVSEEQWDKNEWTELFEFGMKKYIQSIRDVIRFVNVFFLKYGVLKEETNLVDLIGLTTLQVFEPYIYSKMIIYKDILCGNDFSIAHAEQQEKEKKIKDFLNQLIPDDETVDNKDAASNIIGILFPKIRNIADMPYGRGRNYIRQGLISNNRISVPACFDRYFSLSLESDAIPTPLIRYLIYEANELELDKNIMEIYKNGKIKCLLDKIAAYANDKKTIRLSCDRASLIIMVLSRKWSCFKVDDRDKDFFSIPFVWKYLYCVDPLLKRIDSSNRFSVICTIFKDESVQPSTLALLLDDFENQLGRFTERKSKENDAVFSLEEVLILEDIFKKRSIEVIDSRLVLQQYNGLNFLWMLGQIDAELAKEKKKTIITDDFSLLKIIDYCVSKGSVASTSIEKIRKVNKKALEEFIDVNEAYRRIKEYMETEEFYKSPEDEKISAMAFILVMENTNREVTMEDSISEETAKRELKKVSKDSGKE